MAKEWWRFIRAVIFLLLTPLGIYGIITLILFSGGEEYLIAAIIIGLITISMFLSVISYVSKHKEEQKNLEEREQELTIREERLESERNKLTSEIKEGKNDLILQKRNLEEHIKNKENELENWKEQEIQNIENWKKQELQNIQKLAGEKSKGFPFLTEAFNQYFKLKDNELEAALKNKPHPAYIASEQIRQISKERREAEKAARESKHLLDYCKYLAPWLEDYIGIESEELDALIKDIHTSWQKKEEEFEEEVKRHYGPKYQDLSDTEKLQRKLDWYWNKPNKYNWQIGRDYERYIGYLYEKVGCTVYYEGRKGFEDFGRDLITEKNGNINIIQCKRWRQESTIHEKHIFYLFGTTVEYFISNFSNKNNLPQLNLFPELIKNEKIKGTIFTTTSVSEKAKKVAKTLGIQIVEKCPFEPYPSVKCNISRKNREKIYHLPFDQQYDTTLIEEERNECYVWTIEEAEKLGFRHAWRWHGEQTIK